ncbi:MAG: hypothetical protein ISN28_13665 [Ectothiorhodospiraceae bacterium AqS1]|nr:hypothetical protein [Ectothiorhodospiraceae bacterium AqS1]
MLDPLSDDSSSSADGQDALSHRSPPEDPLPGIAGAGVILEEPWYLLVIPPCSIATADIFNAPSLPRDTPELPMPDFLQGLQRDSSSDADADGAGADIAAKPRIDGGGSALAASRPLPVLQVMARTRNDCEQVVRRNYPEVAGVLDWLESAGANPRMTGTGSTIFAPFADPDRAQRMARQCPLPCRTEVVRGRNRSSLSTMTMGRG